MQIKCVLCERKAIIDDKSIQAKKLLYNPIKIYICDVCYTRIAIKTNERNAKRNNN